MKITFDKSARLHHSHLMFMAADIMRSSLAISENDGLEYGSDDQHLSINDLHKGSHQLGISGRMFPLIMPAESTISKCLKPIFTLHEQLCYRVTDMSS